jgi:hypothetical protein
VALAQLRYQLNCEAAGPTAEVNNGVTQVQLFHQQGTQLDPADQTAVAFADGVVVWECLPVRFVAGLGEAGGGWPQ